MALYVETARQKRRLNVVVYLCLYLPAIILLTRLVQIQVLSRGHYLVLASREHLRKYEVPASRGQIYFEDGDQRSPAVLNQRLKLVWADPTQIDDKLKTAKALAPALGMGEQDIFSSLNQPGAYVPLKGRLTTEDGDKVTALKLKGVGVSDQEYRTYPEGSLASQVLGFVNRDGQGQYGIESFFNNQLAGTPGLLNAKTDTLGNPIATADNIIKPPVNGQGYVLTIDRNIQSVAERYLDAGVKGTGAVSGSVVIMDPNTGAIKAMANFPTFDPNNYSAVSDYQVFTNCVVSCAFEPGSGFKVITMSAGLDTGKVTPQTQYTDTGEFQVDGYTIRNAENHKFGVQTMTDVIMKSLNTGVMFVLRQLGGDPDNITLAGKKILNDYIKRFGFGVATGVEQANESAGHVNPPTNAAGNNVNYANMTFGQGLSVTVMQMVTAVAAIANGGKLYQPRLVDSIIMPDGTEKAMEPKLVNAHVISSKTASDMANMMITVVQHGSGWRAKMPGYSVAGKTGTAQIPRADGQGYETDGNIGSFVGFAPVGHPRFVMMVRINKPKVAGFAESTTVPVFANIANWLMSYYAVPPGQ